MLVEQASENETLGADLNNLYEYCPPVHARLDQEDADYLRGSLGFHVTGPWEENLYLVDPGPHVCRTTLPSSKKPVCVHPKLSIHNVFDMLGVAYGLYTEDRPDPFDKQPEVDYEPSPHLFETIVRHFMDLLEGKLQRGLMADYVTSEENLPRVRGRISFDLHVRSNVVRQDRIFCRYSEFQRDITENRVLLWALFVLSRMDFWTPGTRTRVLAAIKQFHDVSLTVFRKGGFPVFHYHRLNDDYKDLHSWARLFLDLMSFSEKTGDVSFRGFVLNMNDLFEKYVTQAFLAHSRKFEIVDQKYSILFEDRSAQIKPDLLILANGKPVAVADAKYKRIKEDEFKNYDVYQMISYATALGVPFAFLIYPDSEFESDWNAQVRHSPIRVFIQTVSLSRAEISMREQARVLAQSVLQQL